MSDCQSRGVRRASTTLNGITIDVWDCLKFGACTSIDYALQKNGTPLAVCEGCSLFVALAQQGSTENAGDALADVLAGIGIRGRQCCSCATMRKRMNQLGVNGCREHRADIVAHLRAKAAEWWAGASWRSRFKTIGLAAVKGLWTPSMIFARAMRRAKKVI